VTEKLRGDLSDSTDPRVARTRDALFAAVHRLAAQGSTEFGVSDIVREAGVSRSSFYSHFASLQDLAAQLQKRAFEDIAAQERSERGSPDSMRASQERLVAHYAENRILYATVLALPLSHEAHTSAATTMATLIEERLAETDIPAGVVPALASTYIANAAIGLLIAWVRGDVTATSPEIVDHLLALMPTWLRDDATPPTREPLG